MIDNNEAPGDVVVGAFCAAVLIFFVIPELVRAFLAWVKV